MQDSFSTLNIKHNRNIALLMIVFPLIVFGLSGLVLYKGNTRNAEINASTLPNNRWENGYEDSFNGWGATNQGAVGTYQKSITTSVVREGSKAGRFEVRDGDCPLTGNCATDYGERSEVQGSTANTGGYEGDVRWYKWSTRFAAPFDTNKGFQVFSQWHDNGDGSPPIGWYAEGGKILLVANINYSDSISYGNVMYSAPLQTDKWYDIKMRVLWSGSDTVGQVSLWMDGQPVTLTKSTSKITTCSGNTCTVRTLRPGSSTYYKQGLYRSVNYSATSVVYQDGFVAATTEAGLGGSPPPTPPAPSPVPAPSPTPTPSTQSSYGNKKTLPAKLEAEDYDQGGEGIAYHDTSTANVTGKYRNDGVDIESAGEGGYDVGYNDIGEWREHTVNTTTGTYKITARVSSAVDGGQLRIKLDGQTLGTINVPNTGGWQAYQSVSLNNISIPGGSNKVLRFETLNNYYTINWVDFSLNGSTSPNPVPTPSPIPAPLPPSPLPPIEIPGSNSSDPVSIPTDLPTQSDGSLIGDFNGDGSNDVAKDTNGDGKIDPTAEIVVDGTTNPNLTDSDQSPISVEDYNTLLSTRNSSQSASGTLTLKVGPLPEVRLAKPIAYTFLIAQGVAITGIGTYLAITKLTIFATIRGKWGL